LRIFRHRSHGDILAINGCDGRVHVLRLHLRLRFVPVQGGESMFVASRVRLAASAVVSCTHHENQNGRHC
jgi:hypothetical protein